jgi:hypothetical protein
MKEGYRTKERTEKETKKVRKKETTDNYCDAISTEYKLLKTESSGEVF